MRFAQPFRFFRRSTSPVIDHDPADLGTAFGMEASLESEPHWTQPGSVYPLESETLPRSESPLAWLSRKT